MAMKLEGISEKTHCQTDSFWLVNVLPEGCSGHKGPESVKYPLESVILDWNMQLSRASANSMLLAHTLIGVDLQLYVDGLHCPRCQCVWRLIKSVSLKIGFGCLGILVGIKAH